MVLFASPAESRELGGFVGNIGILNAHDGELDLDEVVRVRELNAKTAALPDDHLREILGPDYPERYLRYTPWEFWQNVTGTPDFPTVGRMVQDLAPDAIGRPIDGVMYVDPEGLAALAPRHRAGRHRRARRADRPRQRGRLLAPGSVRAVPQGRRTRPTSSSGSPARRSND